MWPKPYVGPNGMILVGTEEEFACYPQSGCQGPLMARVPLKARQRNGPNRVPIIASCACDNSTTQAGLETTQPQETFCLWSSQRVDSKKPRHDSHTHTK
eukprot:645756-Amphidinium_carterae.1